MFFRKKVFVLLTTMFLLLGSFGLNKNVTFAEEEKSSPGDVTVSLTDSVLTISSEDSDWISALSVENPQTWIYFYESESFAAVGDRIISDGSFVLSDDGKTVSIPTDKIPKTIYDETYYLNIHVDGYLYTSSNNTIDLNRGIGKTIHVVLHGNGGVFGDGSDELSFDLTTGYSLDSAPQEITSILFQIQERSNYYLLGFSESPDGPVTYDFSTKLVSDIELYARYCLFYVEYDKGFKIYTDNENWIEGVTSVNTSREQVHGFDIYGDGVNYYSLRNTEAFNIIEKKDGYIFVSEKNLINYCRIMTGDYSHMFLHTGIDTENPFCDFDPVHIVGAKEAPLDVLIEQDKSGNLVISSNDKDYLKALTEPNKLGSNGEITEIGSRINLVEPGATSSDATKRKVGGKGVIANAGSNNPLRYDESKGVTIVSWEDLLASGVGADSYRLYVRASGYDDVFKKMDIVIPGFYNVKFNPNNGEAEFIASVIDGQKVEKPEAPVYAGHAFLGWYLNEELYDFSAPVTGNITITAKWMESEIETQPNSVPDYTDEAKNEVAEEMDKVTTDISDVIANETEILITPEVLEALSSDEAEALGENPKIVIETVLKMEVNEVEKDDSGKIVNFVVDIEPQYSVKAVNENTGDEVKLADWTPISGIKESVKMKVYLPSTMADYESVWVKHKETVLGEMKPESDVNGTYIEFDNSEGFSPFEISKEKLYSDVVSVELDKDQLTIVINKTEKLNVEVKPAGVKDDSITWSSSNEEIVTVDTTGTLKGIKPGTAKITATSVQDKTVSGICEVRVLFSDVTDPSQFYYEYVYSMSDRGIVNGWDDGTFRPNELCNRAAIITFLWKMAGRPMPEKQATFRDMTDDADFNNAISWGVENGIVTGWTEDNTFRPWDKCNRAAIITFLWRYAGRPMPEKQATFKDMTGNADFDNAISWGVENGITTGWDDNTFRPWDKCKRLAAVSFLGRSEDLN